MINIKKFGSVIALTALLGFSSAVAANNVELQVGGKYCFQDTNYPVVTLELGLQSGVVVGEAQYSLWPYSGAITGNIRGGVLSFAISYPDMTGLRFYEIALGSFTGSTWGAYNNPPGGLYDSPHSATLVMVPCGLTEETGGPTGAAE